jgi:hypothetical protein
LKGHGFSRAAKQQKIFWASQAAEKGLIGCKIPDEYPAGAKAQRLFCSTYGTTKVVPCYKTSQLSSFSAACSAPEGWFGMIHTSLGG